MAILSFPPHILVESCPLVRVAWPLSLGLLFPKYLYRTHVVSFARPNSPGNRYMRVDESDDDRLFPLQ
jgi:hypothetical protein